MTKIHMEPYRADTPEVNCLPLLAEVAISTTGEKTTISVDAEGNASLPEGMSHGESLLLIAAMITGNRIMDGGIYEATLRKWLPVETLVGTKMTWGGIREDSNTPATPAPVEEGQGAIRLSQTTIAKRFCAQEGKIWGESSYRQQGRWMTEAAAFIRAQSAPVGGKGGAS